MLRFLSLTPRDPCLDDKKKDGLYTDRIRQVRRCNPENFLFEKRISDDDVIFSSTRHDKPFKRGIDMQRLSKRSTGQIMGKNGFFVTFSETVARSPV